jgi:hypothetical protein
VLFLNKYTASTSEVDQHTTTNKNIFASFRAYLIDLQILVIASLFGPAIVNSASDRHEHANTNNLLWV